jgi:hypothetical protein
MWIPSHSGITRNEREDEAAKNVLEDINDRELYPPQDLINYMKTDKKGGHREKTIEWKDDSSHPSRNEQGIQTKDRVHTSYT